MRLYFSDGTTIPMSLVYVDNFGAVGDGVTDDTSAIQDALDSATDGGRIVFKKGTYLITEPLIVYSNQVIDLNGSTILQGAAINNLMRGYCTPSTGLYNGPHDIVIQNGIFDGGNFTTNNTLLGFCHAKNITIKNCTFKNAYGAWHNIEINSSKFVLIHNCYFEGSRKNNYNGCLIQVDSFSNSATWPWGDGKIDSTVSSFIEIADCHFYNDTVSPAIGNHSVTVVTYIFIHDCTFEGLTSNRGAINFQSANYVDCRGNTFVNCTKCLSVTSNGSNDFVANRVDNATTLCSGDILEFANIVDGSILEKTIIDDVMEDYSAALVALGVTES